MLQIKKRKQPQDVSRKVSNDWSSLRRNRARRIKKVRKINKRLERITTKNCLYLEKEKKDEKGKK